MKTRKLKKNMGLRKGMCNNPSGRPKGSKNKVTTDMKKVLKDFLTSKVVNLNSLYDDLLPNEKANFFIKLLPFVVPKMSEISAESEINLLLNNVEKLNDDQLDRLAEIINGITSERNG